MLSSSLENIYKCMNIYSQAFILINDLTNTNPNMHLIALDNGI